MKYTSDDLTLVHTLILKILYDNINTIRALSSKINISSGIWLFVFSSSNKFDTSNDSELLLSRFKNESDRTSRRLINMSSKEKIKAQKISNQAKVPSGRKCFVYI